MAVFEQKKSSRVGLDDTHTLACHIEASENVQGHTVYVMSVWRGPMGENSWQVCRRYSDFDALNGALCTSGLELPLPPKKMFGNMDREFVAERQQGLQNYINAILSHPLLASSHEVKRFLDPENYSSNFSEMALQHVSMVFRCEPQWDVVEPLLDMGWRIRKKYFLVKPKTDVKRLLLAWTLHGPDSILDDRDLQVAGKLLCTVQHPYISAPVFAYTNENSGIFIREFECNETIRDVVCKCKPRGHFLKKYGNRKLASPLPPTVIKTYGRQVLVALKFLHDRGMFHGHLHAGNVVIENNVCRLLEIENQLLGLPSCLRPLFVQLKKVQTMENIDVYCFGHLLHEMAFGFPCTTPACNAFPSSCPPELRSVLEAILTSEACKNGLPTISNLLLHPFFAGEVKDNEKGYLKVSIQLKECFRRLKDQVENRLREDRRTLRHSLRRSKAQLQLASEEEKRQRPNERRKQKLNSGNTTPVQNGPTLGHFTPGTVVSEMENGFPSADLEWTSAPVAPPVMPMDLPGSSLPPPPPPPPPPGMSPSPAALPATSVSSGQENNPALDRSALLSSIQSFSKGNLRKATTRDHSSPCL